MPIFSFVFMMILCLTLAHVVQNNRITYTPNDGRAGCLDGLRGFLALAVVAHHHLRTWNKGISGSYFGPFQDTFFENSGPVAVSLFFSMTGFLFYRKIINARAPIDWYALYVSRLCRLTPAYMVSLCFVLLLVASESGWHIATPASTLLRELLSWAAFTLPGATLVNGVDAGSFFSGVVWTLRYEWAFYIALPILALLIAPLQGKRYARIVLIVTLWLGASAMPPLVVAHFSSRIAAPFCLGMLACELQAFATLRAFSLKPIGTLICVISFGALFSMPSDTGHIFRAPFILFIFYSIATGNSLFGLLNSRSSVFLGDASYGIYIYHGVIIHSVSVVASPYVSLPANAWLALLPPLGLLVSISGIVSYRFVELPAIVAARRFLRNRSEIPVLMKPAP